MDLLKKHVDTVVILSAFAASILWMNSKFNDINDRFHSIEIEVTKVSNEVDKIKTIMIMQKIMPAELAKQETHLDGSN